MALTGISNRKTATLLMNLDLTTASKLLEGFPSEVIQQLAVEMAQINASGRRNKKEEMEIVREFCGTLQKEGGGSQVFSLRSFLKETIVKLFGVEKAEEIQSQVKEVVQKKNPFKPMQLATVDELILVLQNESPTTIARVLSELDPKKAGEILSLWDKEVCSEIVWNMTKTVQMRNRTKQRIASVVAQRLKSFKGETLSEKPEETLRNLAIVLSDTQKTVRDQALDDVKGRDEKIATMVRDLMVTWEDIPSITDRSLQEVMRAVESSKFAMAMYGADEEIVQKIRSNISQRAAAAIDEEVALMQEPLEEEILEAREEVVKPLREANEAGTLRRVKV
ncbi:MAG: FliG C-terminal domain-containing protein [Planctomycetota bacterium]|jgi:flagellar motor switch protein FliG